MTADVLFANAVGMFWAVAFSVWLRSRTTRRSTWRAYAAGTIVLTASTAFAVVTGRALSAGYTGVIVGTWVIDALLACAILEKELRLRRCPVDDCKVRLPEDDLVGQAEQHPEVVEEHGGSRNGGTDGQ